MYLVHNTIDGGHRSAAELLPRMQQLVYWPKMKTDLHHWCDEICLPCARRRRQGRVGYFRMRKATGGPFRWVQTDLVGPISPAGIGPGGVEYRYILTYICVFTKFVYFRPLVAKDATDVARVLLDIFFESCSWPLVIQSDNGTEFVNWIMTEVLRLSSICHVRGSAYTPRVQGIIESQHRALGAGLCILVCEFLSRYPTNWPSMLGPLQYHSRVKPLFGKVSAHTLVHGWTGVSPLEASLMPSGDVLVGNEHEGGWLENLTRELKDMHSWLTAATDERQQEIRRAHDKRIFPVHFSVGDHVVVEKPIFDQTRGSKLVNRAIGVGTITHLSPDQMSATVEYSAGIPVDKKVATSRLIAFPYVLRHSPTKNAEFEVRGFPKPLAQVQEIPVGHFLIYGRSPDGQEELINLGIVIRVDRTEARFTVDEYFDKGTGAVASRSWVPAYTQNDGRVGPKHSSLPVQLPVPFSRVYASFGALGPKKVIPLAVIRECAQDRGIFLGGI